MAKKRSTDLGRRDVRDILAAKLAEIALAKQLKFGPVDMGARGSGGQNIRSY